MTTDPAASASQTRLVGRDFALRELQDYLYAALGGSHQVVFITGEAGIGKSALVHEFERQADLLGNKGHTGMRGRPISNAHGPLPMRLSASFG